MLVIIIPASYNIASLSTSLIGLVPVYFLSLLYVTKVEKYRYAFYAAWISALATFSIHMNFFLNIFGSEAVILWVILSFWPATFVLLSKFILTHSSTAVKLTTIPALFFTLEIISCELYPLRFSWCNIGYMTHQNPSLFGVNILGIYGLSLVIFTLTLLSEKSAKRKFILPGFIVILSTLAFFKPVTQMTDTGPRVTGIQLEFPEQSEVLNGLERALKAEPQTDIFMLSEYTFENGIPQPVKDWCKKNKTYLICGTTFKTKDSSNFYNTAAVVNPQGEIEFKQAKAQPIQFFNDGLPAVVQIPWESPWGKIGLCICYDLSYGKVIDKLVNQGAQALFVPTMDVESWGESEHKLHARVAPVRATEYGIPIFKTASSGISQAVNSRGQVLASASFPGQGEILSCQISVEKSGSKPIDRYLFWPAFLLSFYGLFTSFLRKKRRRQTFSRRKSKV